LHADYGHPGSFLFTAMQADASGLYLLGFVRDIDPYLRSIYGDLVETWQAAISISISTIKVGFEDLSARKKTGISAVGQKMN